MQNRIKECRVARWSDNEEVKIMITVYLNDYGADYIELQTLVIKDDWAHGVDTDGRDIHIPLTSILYIVEDSDD